MTILNKKNAPLIRTHVTDIGDCVDMQPARNTVPDSVDYHDGNDRYHIEKKMAERFAVEVGMRENAVGEQEQFVTKSLIAEKAAIDAHLFEVTPRGMTNKICMWIASLAETSEWTYLNNGKEDSEAAESITAERMEGGFGLALGRVDELSVLLGSSAMLIQIVDDKYNYQPIAPDAIWIAYGDTVTFDGLTRSPMVLNLDDAVSVTVSLGDDMYVTYYGRSDKYPKGRMVKYEGSAWSSVPDFGAKDADDYIGADGEMANPLTEWQDKQQDWTTPEYPVVIWQGSTSGIGRELMPITDRMYQSSLEIDLSASRSSMAANKGGRGMWVLESGAGSSGVIPDIKDEGFSKLSEGQKAVVLTVPAANIAEARNSVEADIDHLGDSNGIPPYLMTLSKNTQVPSGQALIEASKPLEAVRNKRAQLNKSGMSRLFDIERALGGIETDTQVMPGVEQVWTVKPLGHKKTKAELLEEAKLEQDLGITDKAGIVVYTNPEIDTRDKAEAYLADLKVAVEATPQANTGVGTAGRLVARNA